MANFNDLQFEGKDGIADAYNSVTSALKQAGFDVLINDTSKNEYVPYGRFSEVIGEKNRLSSELALAKEELNNLKNSEVDSEVRTQLQAMTYKNNELIGQIRQLNIKQAVMSMAKDAIDVSDVMSAINADALTIDEDGNVTGVDTEIQRIRESKPHWFSKPPKKGGSEPNGAGAQPITSDMNRFIRAMAGRK